MGIESASTRVVEIAASRCALLALTICCHCEPTGPAFGRPDDRLREAISPPSLGSETKRAARESGPHYFAFNQKRSGAAAPEAAVAPRHERQAVGVARHALVLRQLELLLGFVPALAGLAELLHLGRGVLIKRQHVLGVLLGTEP